MTLTLLVRFNIHIIQNLGKLSPLTGVDLNIKYNDIIKKYY